MRTLRQHRIRAGIAVASLVVGLPLLMVVEPAVAAGVAGMAVGGAAASLGLVAALWALLGAPTIDDAATGMATLVVAAASVGVLWGLSKLPRGASPARRGAIEVAPRSASSASRASRVRGNGPAVPVAVPPGLDGEQVLDAARGRFIGLQAAWDAGDVAVLQKLTTPDMLDELMLMLTSREVGGSRTDVITLHAELLALEELGPAYLASVEFSGLIRESDEQGEQPFRELWMLASSKDGSPSWRLARQQALF